MNYPKLWQSVIGLTLTILCLVGCASPPSSAKLVNNWYNQSNAGPNLFAAKPGGSAATPVAINPTATQLPEPTPRIEPVNEPQSQTPPQQAPLVLPFGDRTTLAGLPCASPAMAYPTATPVLNPDATIEPDEGDLEASPTSPPTTQEPSQIPATVEPGQPDTVDAIFIQDQYAYLNLGSNLVMLDISNPVQPVVAGSAALPANTPAAAIYVLDHYAYVLADGLRIFDVLDPTQPVEVGCFSLPIRDWMEYTPMISPSPPPHRRVDVVVHRAETGRLYAYIAAHAAGLRIVDVSDPAAPVEVGSYEFKPTPAITGIVLSGNLAYLASPDGLRIVDISRPTQPVAVGLFPAISWDVTVAGHQAYLVEGKCSPLDGCDFGSLQVVDVANPAQPVRLAQTPLTYSQVVALSGENIYVATRYGLAIFRQTDLNQSLSFWPREAAIIITDIAVTDNYLYLAAGRQGLKILDVSEATAPTQAGEFP